MTEWSIDKVQEILPHRYPFLLIDRVVSVTDGQKKDSRVGRKLKAIKCVTVNEEYFNGHFPKKPIMPGVLQIEAMAQAGGLACYLGEQDKSFELLIAGIQKAKFRKQVIPGDVLNFEVEVVKERKMKADTSLVVIDCKAFVDGAVVSECEIMASIHLNK